MNANTKVITGIIIVSVVLLGGAVFLLSQQGTKQQEKITKPLVGEAIADQGANHIPESTTAAYLTNPPTGGPHYTNSSKAGIYDKAPADGNLIHSMEHGAVILWYKSDIPASDSAKLKTIFTQTPVSKKIMAARTSLDVPVALTSWGRLLKLQTIDEAQIKNFMTNNEDRGPEKAPL